RQRRTRCFQRSLMDTHGCLREVMDCSTVIHCNERPAQAGLSFYGTTAIRDACCWLVLKTGIDVQSSIQAVLLVIGTRGEEQCVDRLVVEAIAELDAPQPVDVDRPVVLATQAAH